MLYLPASDQGLLIYFGGILDPYRNGTVVGSAMSVRNPISSVYNHSRTFLRCSRMLGTAPTNANLPTRQYVELDTDMLLDHLHLRYCLQ